MPLALEKKYQTDPPELEGANIQGYASLFDLEDQQGDQVARGAFQQSLQKRPASEVKMLWQHDPTQPIGVWSRIQEDERGLYVEGRILEDIKAGREALVLLRAGAVNGLSIGYRTLISGKTKSSGRILKTVDLWEISLVTFPMLPEARVNMSEATSRDRAIAELREATSGLRKVFNEE